MKRFKVIYFIVLLQLSTRLVAQDFERIDFLAGLSNLSENSGVAVADYDQDFDLDIFVMA